MAESGEQRIDETGRNPTQRRIDEQGQEGPVDASWEPERYGELPEEPDEDDESPR
jgi:hypothetical protein